MSHQTKKIVAGDPGRCAAISRGALLRRDAGLLEELSVALGVSLAYDIELSWRGRCRDRSLREQLLFYVRHLENLGDVLAYLREDRLWRAGRREHAEPRLIFILGQGLCNGRNIRQLRNALGGIDSECSYFPRCPELLSRGDRRKIHLRVVAYDGSRGLRCALVRNMHYVDVGILLENFRGYIR